MICHNHWTIGGAKISKSKGNYIPLSKLSAFVGVEKICDVDSRRVDPSVSFDGEYAHA